jgi:hypothetical protein
MSCQDRIDVYFDSNVARENSWNESTPSWLVSSWSKILRAWPFSADVPDGAAVAGPEVAVDGIVAVDVVDVLDEVSAGGAVVSGAGGGGRPARVALVAPDVPGVAATPAVPCGRIGCSVRVPACASDCDPGICAHAAPAMPTTATATAVTSLLT